MSTTLANLRTNVRIELRDPDGITHVDADVDYAINQAYRKVFKKIAAALKDHFVTTANVNLVADQATYALPSSYIRTKRLEYVSGDITIPLKRRERGSTVNYTGGSAINVDTDTFLYDFQGDNFVLEPTPKAAKTNGIKHTYYADAATLVASGDTINSNFKDSWADVVVVEAAFALLSTIEAGGGIVSTNIDKRLKELNEMLEEDLALRTLSPVKQRRKGYFQ